MNGANSALMLSRPTSERALTEIWGEVLGMKAVGLDDDFFDLGGDSISAAEVLVRIEKVFGLRLPLSVFIEMPTVNALTAAVDCRTWSVSWSPLVPLQPTGSRPPFFCVHGVGGDVCCFQELARLLGMEQPFYGLQAIRSGGHEQPRTTIEEMASGYLREVRTHQPQGPYYLGGFSFGGSVALEMAQQLRALGQEVALLAILDHTPPPLRFRRLVWNPRVAIDFAVNVTRWFHEEIYQGRPGGRLAHLRQKGAVAWQQIVKAARPSVSAHADTEEIIAGRNIPEEFRQQVTTNYQALRDYVPKVYPGRVTLLRARTRPLFRLHGCDLGWGVLAGGGLEIVEVPGNHETILKEPNVRFLADALRTRLRGV